MSLSPVSAPVRSQQLPRVPLPPDRPDSTLTAPREYSNEQIIAALEQSDGHIIPAAVFLGCSPDTIRYRVRTVREVAEALNTIRGHFVEELVDSAEDGLKIAVKQREPWAIPFALKTQGKNRGYVERSEISGKDGSPLLTGNTIVVVDHTHPVLEQPSVEEQGEDASQNEITTGSGRSSPPLLPAPQG